MADEDKPNSIIEGIVEGFKEVNDKNHKPLRDRITEGFKENYERLSKSANVFAGIKDGINTDMGKFGMMLAPLQAIPGFSTVQALIQGSLSFIAKKGIDILMKILGKIMSFGVWNKLNEKFKNRREKKRIAREKRAQRRALIMARPMNDPRNTKMDKIRKGGLLRFLGIGAMFGTLRGLMVTAFGTFTTFMVSKYPWMTNLNPKNWKWVTGFRTWIGNIGTWANPKNWKWVQSAKDWMGAAVQSVKKSKFAKKVKDISAMASNFKGFVPGFLRGAFIGLRTFFGVVLMPLTIIIATIMGMIEGFKKYGDQGFWAGAFGGVMMTIKNLATWIVTMPIDLAVWVVGWIMGLFGFDGVKEKLMGFSLTDYVVDLFDNITQGVIDLVKNIGTLWSNSSGLGDFMGKIKVKFMNMLRGIVRSMLPDPNAEGFLERSLSALVPQPLVDFANEVQVDKDIDLNRSTKPRFEPNSGEKITDATVNAEEAAFNAKETGNGGGTNNVVTSNNTVNQGSKKTYIAQSQMNADPFGYQLSYN